MAQTQINIRVDDDLKSKAYLVLKKEGITPAAFFNNVLEYIATTGQLPAQNLLLSVDDMNLIKLARKRISELDKFEEITFDDLLQLIGYCAIKIL